MRAKFAVADESSRKFIVLHEPDVFVDLTQFYAIFRAIPGCTRGLLGVSLLPFSIYMLLSRACG